MGSNASAKLGTEIFLNNEMHKRARKNFMEEALTARMRRYALNFFRVILCLFVVKKYCHPVSPDAVRVGSRGNGSVYRDFFSCLLMVFW